MGRHYRPDERQLGITANIRFPFACSSAGSAHATPHFGRKLVLVENYCQAENLNSNFHDSEWSCRTLSGLMGRLLRESPF